MAITKRILRYEKTKDREGNDEVFMQVEVNDGKEIYTHAEWLATSEVAEIMKNDSKHLDHAEAMAQRAVVKRPSVKAEQEHVKAIEKLSKEIELEKLKKAT